MFACIISDKDDALELARAVSPRVQRLSYVDKTSAFLIDLGGLDRLLGSPLEIARKIFAQGAQRVAVAANPDAAICAAQAYPGVTVVQQGRELTFHAGGGIVADSEPDAEYDETFAKAQGILNAIDQLRLR